VSPMDPALDATLRAALALLFVVAAAHKLRDPRRFRAVVAEYRIVPASLAPGAAALVVAAELAVLGTLLVPALRRSALVSVAALLLVYAGAVGVNLARGRRDLDCGCAGPAHRRPIGGWLVVRNVALAAAALAGVAPLRPRSLVWVDGLTVAAGATGLAMLYAAIDRLVAHAPARLRVRA